MPDHSIGEAAHRGERREGALDESFTALVRGPVSTYPRGFPLIIPAWLAVVAGLAGLGWAEIIGPLQWWYFGPAAGGLLIAGVTMMAAMATIRRPAFRADRNGIRLGVRTEHPRPRHRQAQLWWSDVRQLRVEPQPYGLMLEISLGPAARIGRRRGPGRQALLALGLFLLPFAVGRGTPRLTEPRRTDPHYRVPLCDVTPDELGVVLARLALPQVEIIVISRRYGPILARRPQPAAPPARQTPASAAAAGAARPAAARPPAARAPAGRAGQAGQQGQRGQSPRGQSPQGQSPQGGPVMARRPLAWPANIRPGTAGRMGPAPRSAAAPRLRWQVDLPAHIGSPGQPARTGQPARPAQPAHAAQPGHSGHQGRPAPAPGPPGTAAPGQPATRPAA
jgi:hypothetical protein